MTKITNIIVKEQIKLLIIHFDFYWGYLEILVSHPFQSRNQAWWWSICFRVKIRMLLFGHDFYRYYAWKIDVQMLTARELIPTNYLIMDSDKGSKSSCSMVGALGIMIQLGLGVLSFSVLIVKRLR